MRSRLALGVTLLAIGFGLAPTACAAADEDEFRFGGGVNFGATYRLNAGQGRGLEIDHLSQSYGFTLGVDLNRYIGIELSTSESQTDLSFRGTSIGEYGMFAVIPQVRLRYPFLEGRLAPYIVAGVGFSHNEFGDRKGGGDGLSIHANDTRVSGSVGVGVEYMLADNVGLGAELRYMISRGHEIEIEGTRQSLNLDAMIAQARLRVLFPERGAPPEAAYLTDGRYFIDLRYGASYTVHDRIADSIEKRPSLDAIGEVVEQLFSFGIGWDFSRHLGLELSFGGYSPVVAINHIGSVAEYAVYYGIPQLRVRFPLVGGRLVPYLIGGPGLSYMEVKDRKPRGRELGIRGSNVAVVGAIGGGLDYMVASNISLGIEVEYMLSRGHSMTVADGRPKTVDLDALLMTAGLRIFFGKGAAR